MSEFEKNSWLAFKDVVKNLLRNIRADKYSESVQKLLEGYKLLRCNMSIKLHFPYSHLANFPENLGDFINGQRIRFYKALKAMEERYRGRWDVNVMAEYYWSI